MVYRTVYREKQKKNHSFIRVSILTTRDLKIYSSQQQRIPQSFRRKEDKALEIHTFAMTVVESIRPHLKFFTEINITYHK